MTSMEKIARFQSKIAAQRNEIARLTRIVEATEATRRDHVFRLRKIIAGALDGHNGWRAMAERELGRASPDDRAA